MLKKLVNNMSNHLLLDSPVSFEDVNSLDQSTYSALRELRNMRLSITGANGFLASNIVFYLHYLSSKFNLSIHIEALCRSEKKLFSRFTPDYLSSYGPNSLSYSYYSFNDIAHLEPSQVVIHAASNASPLSYSRDPVSTSLINTQGTIAAIEYAKYSNSKCFVYFSTSGVYGFNNPVFHLTKRTNLDL